MQLHIPERIETDRLLLCRLRYEDAEEMFYAYASKPEATRYVSWPTHQSVKETRRYLMYTSQAWDRGLEFSFGIRLKSSNRFIGSFGAIHEHGKIQFGYIISPAQWGRGYATESCQKVLEVFRSQSPVYRIWTFVDADNIASVRVLQKCGLVEEARLSKWFRFINQDNQPKDCIFFKLEF